MEVKEAFHKWANGGKTLLAYGPGDEGGYSLLEYNGGRPKELFRNDSLGEIQAAFCDYDGTLIARYGRLGRSTKQPAAPPSSGMTVSGKRSRWGGKQWLRKR